MPTTLTFAAIVAKLYRQISASNPLELSTPERVRLAQYADPDIPPTGGLSPEALEMLFALTGREDFHRPLEAAQALLERFAWLRHDAEM